MKKDEIVGAVKKFFSDDQIEYIKAPGTLEGGDVMMVGDHFCRQIRKNQRRHSSADGSPGKTRTDLFRGKAGESAAPEDRLTIWKTTTCWYRENSSTNPEFAQYNKVVIPEEEAYAANCIWVNDTVIVPEGYPTVLKAVQDLGYKTLVVDTSEYHRKLDGGLSCLSPEI